MKTKSLPVYCLTVFISLLLLLTNSSKAVCQAGINLTYDYDATVIGPMKTQSPPVFPGGVDKLKQFIRTTIKASENPIKLGKKTWLMANLDKDGKVVSLLPSHDSDPALRQEMERVGKLMPQWKPGTVNGKKVDTKFEFLMSR